MTSQLFYEDQTPTAVIDAIVGAGSRHFEELCESDRGVLGIGKLRLAGLYDDRHDGTFMLRVRLPAGRLGAEQAEVLSTIASEYARRPEAAEGPERFVEVTTRQDLQIHWIRFEHLPEIWRRFAGVGLGSLASCGNTVRNITACCVDGLDPDGIFEVGPVVSALEDLMRTDESLSAFLPRKFKIAVTGCPTDCVIARLQCLALTPARRSGRVGFNVHAGGGLSDYPRLASALDLFVEPPEVPTLLRAVLETYAALGDYEHASVNRFRALVHELGPMRLAEEVRRRMPVEPQPAGEDLSRWSAEDHLGVHRDRQGTSYVGLCVTLGLLTPEDLAGLARLARTHGDGQLRLTQRQNLVLSGIRDVDALFDDPLLQRLRPDADPFSRAIVACTSAPFCKFAILATKPYGAALTETLRQRVPAASWARLEGLRIHLSGCKASCAQPQAAHVGLRASMSKDDNGFVEAFDVALGGDVGAGRFARWSAGAVPADRALDAIADLLSEVAGGELDLRELAPETIGRLPGAASILVEQRS